IDAFCAIPFLFSFPTRRSSDLFSLLFPLPLHLYTGLANNRKHCKWSDSLCRSLFLLKSWRNLETSCWTPSILFRLFRLQMKGYRSEEHTSELQSHFDIVCRLLL